ncbi:MAG: hypothetical protein HY698_21570 [Deltaproteobacteria bacterium]|nr:hypothetical protein [Deltaproteobacteria bacterium]
MRVQKIFFAILVTAIAAGCTGSNSSDPLDGTPDSGVLPPKPPEPPPQKKELCNGLDDDSDGAVDETCTCASGKTQSCWPLEPAQRGKGICRDGQQLCSGDEEFASWGPCEGFVGPKEDVPGNGVDENCDGKDGADCQPQASGERCQGGRDEDCDGLIDCKDPDCADYGGCQCKAYEAVCTGGLDEDCDGLIDCKDSDCSWMPVCNPTDKECKCKPGAVRFCDSPVQCLWGTQECMPDMRWGACLETNERPGPCNSYYYNPWCCVSAGACCEDPWTHANIGNCTNQVECTP